MYHIMSSMLAVSRGIFHKYKFLLRFRTREEWDIWKLFRNPFQTSTFRLFSCSVRTFPRRGCIGFADSFSHRCFFMEERKLEHKSVIFMASGTLVSCWESIWCSQTFSLFSKELQGLHMKPPLWPTWKSTLILRALKFPSFIGQIESQRRGTGA